MHKTPTLVQMDVLDYQDYVQAFTDLGDEDATLGKCGARTYSLTDRSDVANALSWITLVQTATGTPDAYEIRV